MKAIYLCLLLFVAASANAQDLCRQIKKEVSDNKLQSDYSSPADPAHMPPVRMRRSISVDPEFSFDTYTMIFQAHCGLDAIYDKTADGGQTEKKEKMLVITFDDNSRLTDDTTDVSHDFSEDRTEAIRSLYLPLTDAMVNDFSSKKIVKFSMAGQERLFPADSANALMQYVKCIKAMK